MTLLHISIGWLAGLALAPYLELPTEYLALEGLLSAALLWLRRRDPMVGRLAWAVLAALLAIARSQAAQPHFDAGDLAYYRDRGAVRFQGVVAQAPILRERWVDLRVRAQRLEWEGQWRAVEGAAALRVPRDSPFAYGDVLLIEGRLAPPSDSGEFSYADYLARQGVYTLVEGVRATRIAGGAGDALPSLLVALADRAEATLRRAFPDPAASLLAGILLGRDSQIPRDVLEAFRRTNTAHIIAISGFNISVIAGVLSGLGRRTLGARRAVLPTLAGIALYTLLVGASPSVVRAAIMGGLYVLAAHLGRPRHALTLLGAAALAMTLWNPLLLWDVGFQLSFAATLGLILHAGPLQARLSNAVPGRVAALFGEAILVTLVAQLWVAPILLHNFRQFSIVSLLANALIAPAQPAVMILGGLATVAGLLWEPLGAGLSWLAWPFLAWTIQVVDALARLPGASLEVEPLGLFPAAIYYAGLLSLGWVRTGLERLRQAVSVVARPTFGTAAMGIVALLDVAIWTGVAQGPDGYLHVTFLDVGQGDAILIETPQGSAILVDGGPDPSRLRAALGRELSFGDRDLELVVVTHPEEDHMGGLLGALESYEVEMLLHAGQSCDSSNCDRFWAKVEEAGTPLREMRAGMRLQAGSGLSLQVLHPPEAHLVGTSADVNNNSIVLRLAWGRMSVLLTGDIQEEAERVISRSGRELRSVVLKVPHHGAATSLSTPFLRRVGPQVAIISAGADNTYGHPAPTTLAKLEGITLLRTDLHKTIEIVSDGERYWIMTGQ